MADERSRVEASQALADQLGTAAAAALMECIPPFGWHEIATKRDLRQLEDRIDLRFDAWEARFHALEARFDALGSKVDGRIEGLEGRLTALINEKLVAQHRALLLAVGATIIVSVIVNLLR